MLLVKLQIIGTDSIPIEWANWEVKGKVVEGNAARCFKRAGHNTHIQAYQHAYFTGFSNTDVIQKFNLFSALVYLNKGTG